MNRGSSDRSADNRGRSADRGGYDRNGGSASRNDGTIERGPRGDRDRGGYESRRDNGGATDRNGGTTYRNGDSGNRNGGYDRNDRNRNGGYDRNGGSNNRNDRNRNGGYDRNDRNRNGGHNNGGYNGGRYGSGQPYHTRGRISHTRRYDGGYRVWIVGAPYPFFVPDRYYRRDRFGIGLWIDLGGYYNPLGYYDYYDGYDGYSSYRNRSYSRGEIRGVVESVDSRRSSFVLRNEDTGSFVTVVPRGQRVYVRPGDYVEVDGTWNRSGFFTAYDIDWPEGNRYRDPDERYDERYDR